MIVSTVVANAVTIATFIWKKFGEGKKPVEKVIINRREEIKWTQEVLTCVIEEEFKKETLKKQNDRGSLDCLKQEDLRMFLDDQHVR